MHRSVKENPCLVIFCRRPVPGRGKRRLAAEIGDQATAEVAALLLDTTLEDARAWPGPVVIAPAELDDMDWAKSLLTNENWRTIAQPAGNLGQRINHVDRQLRATGIMSTVFIGSDAPALRPSDYLAALEALQHHETVLAPASDGGVTLMGSTEAWPDLSSLPWSTDQLDNALQQCCESIDRRTARLVERCDVDHADDLCRLAAELKDDPRPARIRLRHWIQDWLDTAPCKGVRETGP